MKDDVTFVKAKCFFDGVFRMGVLLPVRANGERSIKCLEYNSLIKCLDWIVYQVYKDFIVVLKRRINNQYQLF